MQTPDLTGSGTKHHNSASFYENGAAYRQPEPQPTEIT
jgi:hypothetical protein